MKLSTEFVVEKSGYQVRLNRTSKLSPTISFFAQLKVFQVKSVECLLWTDYLKPAVIEIWRKSDVKLIRKITQCSHVTDFAFFQQSSIY